MLLRSLSNALRRYVAVTEGWSLAIVIVALLGLALTAGWLLAPQLREQADSLAMDLPKLVAQLQKRAEQYPLGQWIVRASFDVGQTMWRFPGSLASSATAALTGVLVVLFVGLYLAAAPRHYIEGLLRLMPPRRRDRAREILEESGLTLQRWLWTQFLLMAINATVVSIGLWLLNVPMALSLGILSGLLNFIPNFGPIIAAIPAILVAFAVNPALAFQVALFYFLYQMFDGYVLTPLVQERAVCLAPALTIMAQVLLGVLLGSIGVVFAVPLLAIVLVVVKMAYIEDVLGEHVTPCNSK